MAFLFRNRSKSGPELAKMLKESLQKMLAEEHPSQKVQRQSVPPQTITHSNLSLQTNEDVAKCLSQMKLMVQGTQGSYRNTHLLPPSLTACRNRGRARASLLMYSSVSARRPLPHPCQQHPSTPFRSAQRHASDLQHRLPLPAKRQHFRGTGRTRVYHTASA